MKRQLKTTASPLPSVSATDELSVVMHKAYMEDQLFIREVCTLREPAIVLATDLQLNDLDRFCCQQGKFGILTVDPTFCLGDFDVTLSTYRHLLLICKRGRTHPAFIGPIEKPSRLTCYFQSEELWHGRRECTYTGMSALISFCSSPALL